MFVTVARVPVFPEMGPHELDQFGCPELTGERRSGLVAAVMKLLEGGPLLAPAAFPDVFPPNLVLFVDELPVWSPWVLG